MSLLLLRDTDTMFCFSYFSFLSRKKSFPLYQVWMSQGGQLTYRPNLTAFKMLCWTSNIMCSFLSIYFASESMEANGH